jgi:hypothetical protein
VTEFYFNQFKNKIDETLFFSYHYKVWEQNGLNKTATKEGDKITGYKSIMRDITERKEAEQKRKVEITLQTIF